MFGVGLTILAGAIVLALAEYARKKHKVSNEFSRKAVHITRACVIAFWPFFVSYNWVIFSEVIFLAAVIAAHRYKWFNHLRQVDRLTVGEFMYPLGILTVALLSPPAWVFTVAILHLGLADGLAAVAGARWGKHSSFKLFGYTKSIAGLAAFWLMSLAILSVALLTNQSVLGDLTIPVLFLLPLSLSSMEGLSIWGIDNFTVPVAAALALILLA